MESLIKKVVFDKNYWIIRHLGFWLFIYFDQVFNLTGIVDWFNSDITTLMALVLDMFLVYINIYFFLPRLLYRNKIGTYLFWTIISLAIVLFINIKVDDYYFPYTPEELAQYQKFDIVFLYFDQLLGLLVVLFPAIGIKVLKNNWEKTKRIEELNQFQTEAELDKLKKQVNPHFLFNSLNAIYVQAKQKSDKVPESIMNLSNLMRYQTYDIQESRIPLQKELDFIKNYLTMEKMRRDNFEFSIDYSEEVKRYKIEPLLLLPLVENACKYSNVIGGTTTAYVNVKFTASGESLSFNIINSIGNVTHKKEDQYSGLGQSNVKKRLGLLYPNGYSFGVTNDESEYKVMLELPIQTIFH